MDGECCAISILWGFSSLRDLQKKVNTQIKVDYTISEERITLPHCVLINFSKLKDNKNNVLWVDGNQRSRMNCISSNCILFFLFFIYSSLSVSVIV